MEQYMDFLRNRMFRQTLLCHAHQAPSYALHGGQLSAFHVASPARPVSAQASAGPTDVEQFRGPDGITLHSREPLVKAAMLHLAEAWPRAVPFVELRAAARARLNGQAPPDAVADAQALGQALLTFYASASTSLVELSLCPPRLATQVSERPAASPLARHQAATRHRVTNLRHETVELGAFERQLLALLDGSRDRGALRQELVERAGRGELVLEQDGQPVKDAGGRQQVLGQALDAQLPHLARSGLLVA
jgi:methyltransferase-like protein